MAILRYQINKLTNIRSIPNQPSKPKSYYQFLKCQYIYQTVTKISWLLNAKMMYVSRQDLFFRRLHVESVKGYSQVDGVSVTRQIEWVASLAREDDGFGSSINFMRLSNCPLNLHNTVFRRDLHEWRKATLFKLGYQTKVPSEYIWGENIITMSGDMRLQLTLAPSAHSRSRRRPEGSTESALPKMHTSRPSRRGINDPIILKRGPDLAILLKPNRKNFKY